MKKLNAINAYNIYNAIIKCSNNIAYMKEWMNISILYLYNIGNVLKQKNK